ncbi:MAG TPA: hypothetical protein VK168_02475 [Saprospiraceae bacterium]|nr:hypothetical protein [Saprospiraceae bacterium]
MVFLFTLSFFAPILAALFGISLAGTMLWRRKKNAEIRAKSMEQVANQLGLTFSATDSFGLIPQLQGFQLFDRERGRWFNHGKITNVMRGWVNETQVYIFDYSYTISTGKSRKTVTQTVFFANDKNWFLPNFHLKPERWWHTLQKSLGLDSDINFEENPEFSEKFWLKGDFEALIREQFTPELQGFLTERPPAHLEGTNYYLLGYKPKKKMDPDETIWFYRHCLEIVALLQQKKGDALLKLAELEKVKEMKLHD